MHWLNFFREDLSEVIGVYFDGDKIFLARLADKIDFAENIFELDLNSKATVTEQLAAKVYNICNELGWRTSQIGLVLRDGAATTLHTDFNNIPANEIESAIKIWATAHVGKDACYTSIKFDDEIWIEALPVDIVEEYISAFGSCSMNLCALTEIPDTNSDRQMTPFNRAVFAAEIIKYKKSPNIITAQVSKWKFKRISLTAAAIFILVIAGVSAKLSHDYYSTVAQVETIRDNLDAQTDLIALKDAIDDTVAEMSHLNDLQDNSAVNADKFNALINIGKITETDIRLNKIKASGNSFDLEGTAESPNAIKNYLSHLKISALKNIKLGNSTINDDTVEFAIKANFEQYRQ